MAITKDILDIYVKLCVLCFILYHTLLIKILMLILIVKSLEILI